MPLDLDAFDDDQSPAAVPDWNPSGATPERLRDYNVVLAHAEPIYDPVKDVFTWVAAPGQWIGVNPTAGVLPPEIVADIKLISGKTIAFATRLGAVAAVRGSVWRWERGETLGGKNRERPKQ